LWLKINTAFRSCCSVLSWWLLYLGHARFLDTGRPPFFTPARTVLFLFRLRPESRGLLG
jgi:hypothetical protein